MAVHRMLPALLLLFTFLPCPALNAAESSAMPEYIPHSFSETEARKILTYLASDRMMGRDTPSPGLDSAAEYIAAYFRECGLQTVGNSYFHYYDLARVNLDTSGAYCRIEGPQAGVSLDLKEDFVPYGQGGKANIHEAELVFAGYGISAPEYDYDDYAGIDVHGKVVVVLRGEPSFSDSSKSFGSAGYSRYAQIRTKTISAIRHGAIGLVIIKDPLRSLSLKPHGFPWPTLYERVSDRQLPYKMLDRSDGDIPIISGGEALISAVFGSVGRLRSIQQEIDSTARPHSFAPDGLRISLHYILNNERESVRNVVALLPGSEKPEEFVLIGAHYDHVGTYVVGPIDATDDSPDSGELSDSICNGADDNASGTTGLMLIARAYASLPQAPVRSILFVAFSGEEKGLFGSKAFVNAPPVALDAITAMFNMDMIGRNAGDSLSLGSKTFAPELMAINEEANARLAKPFALGFDIDRFYRRSDQWNFVKVGIPSVFYFSGTHEDYHRPSDEVEKINFSKLVRVAQLCANAAWQVAEMDGRLPAPVVDDDEER